MHFQMFQFASIPDLSGCDGKLRWAKKHLEAFRSEVATFKNLGTHHITVEDNPGTSEYVFKVLGLQPTKADWGYLAGDCIHNLRSALDHLVYQLAILGQRRDLTDEEARICMFPIYDDPGQFERRGKSRLKLLRPGEQARIEQLQPFNAWDSSIWPPDFTRGFYSPVNPAPVPAWLGYLNTLENIDKHRLVHATWRFVSWQRALVAEPPIPLLGSTISTQPLEDGTELGRWRYAPPRPELPSDMDIDRYFPIGIALGEPPYMNSAIEALEGMAGAVETVIEVFRPCVSEGLPAVPLNAI